MTDDSGTSNNRRSWSLERINLMYMFFIGVSAFNCTYMLISSQNAFTVSTGNTHRELISLSVELSYTWGEWSPSCVLFSLCFFLLMCVQSGLKNRMCYWISLSLSLSFCISVSWDMSSSSNSHTDTDAQQYRVKLLICLLSITLSSTESASH